MGKGKQAPQVQGKKDKMQMSKRSPKNKPSKRVSQERNKKVNEYVRPNSVPKRTDLRNERTTETQSTSQALVVSNDSIVISTVLETQPAAGIALGIISYALQRGWQSLAYDAGSVYYAYVYLMKFLLNSAKNSTPLITSVPQFLNLITQAMKPKYVPCGAGKVSYKFEVNQTFVVPTYAISMTSGGAWTIGAPTTSKVNGYWPQMQAPSSYSDEAGAVALNSLIQFMTSSASDRGSMTRIVQADSHNTMTDDASMFAVAGQDPGSGFAGLGAPRTLLSLEVPIRSPIFGHVGRTSGNSLVENNRSAAFSRAHGGDPVALGGMMAGVLGEHQIHFKRPPVYKCLDAQEFYDQIAYFVQAAEQYALTDSSVCSTIAAGNATVADYLCPLTFQEYKILFRNVLMLAVSKSQYFSQGLVFQPASVSHKTFNTYKCGVGTYPNSGVALPMLPIVIIEEINCNTMRINVGGKGGVNNPRFVVPVLGEYEDDILLGDDYIVSYSTGENITTYPAFAAPPASMKGKEKVSLEQSISMIDGAAGSGWCYINDTDGLNTLAEYWNAWYARIKPFVDTSDTYAVDGGVSALSQTILTNHYTVGPVNENMFTDKRKKVIEVQNAYALKKVVGITSAQQLLQEPFQVSSNWIKPTNAVHSTGANASENTGFQKVSTINSEPFQLPQTTGGFSDASMSTIHVTLPRTLTHGRNGTDSATTLFVAECRKKGNGGILSTITESLAPTLVGLSKLIPY